MEQVTESTVRAVARRLKQYIDVERREEGFDRSGPLNPLGDFTSTRGGTLYYNSLQDKHLRHYFGQPRVRKQLEAMRVILPGEFDDGHTKGKKGRHRSKSARQAAGTETSRLVDTTARLLLANGPSANANSAKRHSGELSTQESYTSFAESEASEDQPSVITGSLGASTPSKKHGSPVDKSSQGRRSGSRSQVHSASSRSSHSTSPGSPVATTHVATATSENHVETADTPLSQSDPHKASNIDPTRMNMLTASSSLYPSTTQYLSHSSPNLPQGGPRPPLLHTPTPYATPQQPYHFSSGYPPPVINATAAMASTQHHFLAYPQQPSVTAPNPSAAFPPAPSMTNPSYLPYPQGPHPTSASFAYPPPQLSSQNSPLLTNNASPQALGHPPLNLLHSNPEVSPLRSQHTRSNVPQKVMVQSVGVSTFSCCDASTQTLVDAETQTEESTLAKRHSSKKLKTSREKINPMHKAEASSKPMTVSSSASFDEHVGGSHSEHQKQSQQQMCGEIQEELKKGSSTFLDLAREDVEAENLPKGDRNTIESETENLSRNTTESENAPKDDRNAAESENLPKDVTESENLPKDVTESENLPKDDRKAAEPENLPKDVTESENLPKDDRIVTESENLPKDGRNTIDSEHDP